MSLQSARVLYDVHKSMISWYQAQSASGAGDISAHDGVLVASWLLLNFIW